MNRVFFILQVTCIAMLPLLTGFVVAADNLVLGVHPYQSATTLHKAFTPLADYLSHALGQRVRVRISKNYQQHVKHIGEDTLDIAYVGPVPYVQLVAHYGAKPILARLEIAGKPTFQGHIIARTAGSVQRIEDIKGKRFAFGSTTSTMSHLVPRHMMWQSGLGVEQLAGFDFLGNHDNVALAVLSGRYDAGAVKEAVFHRYQPRGLRSVAVTPKISEHIFVTSNRLGDDQVKRLRTAMFNLHQQPNGMAVLQAIKKTVTRLVPAHTHDYDNLRKILAELSSIGVE